MANNFKEFLVTELREAGMNDDQVVAALDKIAANEKLSGKLNGIVKTATEDYTAQVGRVKSLQDRNEYLEKDWYPKADAEYKRLNTEYQKVLGELQTAQASGVSPNFDPSRYMTKDDFDAMAQQMGNRFGTVVKDVSRLASRHAATYREELDTQALDEVATQMAKTRGLSPGSIALTDAYEEMIKPRKQKADEEARANWEKETRAQIERDVRSKNNLPTQPAAVEQSQMFRPTPKDQIPADMNAELVAAWNSAAPGA